MQSRLLLNIMLLALVVALSVIAYKSTHEDADPASTLTALSPASINDISIRHNQRRIVLHRQNGCWMMTQPIQIKANDFRIDTLLKLLRTTSHANYDIAGLDPVQYGLAPAATSIRFNDVEIQFGIANPVNGLRYVRAGESLHLIDDSIYPLLSSQTGTLIARELLPSDAEITKLVLPETTLSRGEDGKWRSSGSDSSGLTTDTIRLTLDNWKNLQAFGVHNYLQREALANIEVVLAGATAPLRFEVTDTDPWLVIARPALDIEYHFDIEAYDGLLRPGAANGPPHDIPEELRRELMQATDGGD